jgi:toluene monooxygenase system protein E
MPSEYEVVSSDLHYNYPDSFELGALPVARWYRSHREGSPFRATDWEAYADPRRTTYRGYNEIQDRKEDVVDGLLRQIDETGYDDDLDAGWIGFLDRWYAPLRFPAHGLQMLAAYIAQMAPASRITNCATFQAGDELRRLQRIAYRTAQLSHHRAGIDLDGHRRQWEEADAFQPMRELIERALVAYDWGEAFVATNFVIKPHLDRLVNRELTGTLGAANGDPILGSVHYSLDEDASWHRAWSTALLMMVFADTPANSDLVSGWIEQWRPRAEAAVAGFASVAAEAPKTVDAEEVSARVRTSVDEDLAVLFPEGWP